MATWAGSVAKNYKKLSSLCGPATKEAQLLRRLCLLSLSSLHARAEMLTFVCLPVAGRCPDNPIESNCCSAAVPEEKRFHQL